MKSCGCQGFLCRDDVAQENAANEGCLITCNPGWKLMADPWNGGSWHCTNISTPICPGKFNTGGSGFFYFPMTMEKKAHIKVNCCMGV